MKQDKLEQNAERVEMFLRHTLGCSEEEVSKVVKILIKKYNTESFESDYQELKETLRKLRGNL